MSKTTPANKCPLCDRTFESDRAVKGHMARSHGGADAFTSKAPEPVKVSKARKAPEPVTAPDEVATLRAQLADAESRAGRDYAAAERAEAGKRDAEQREREALARLRDAEGAARASSSLVTELRGTIAELESERNAAIDDASALRTKLQASPAPAPGADAARVAALESELAAARALAATIGAAWEAFQSGRPLIVRQAPAHRSPAAPRAPRASVAAHEPGATPREPGKRLQRCISCGECRNAKRRERCGDCEAENRPALDPAKWAELTEAHRSRNPVNPPKTAT